MDRKRLIDTNFPTQDNYSLVKMRLNEKTCEKIVFGLGVVSSFALIIGLSVGLTVNKDEPETTSTTSTITTSSTTKTTPISDKGDSLLVMWSKGYKSPTNGILTDFNGVEAGIQWDDRSDASAFSRCSFSYQGYIWILGHVLKRIELFLYMYLKLSLKCRKGRLMGTGKHKSVELKAVR